MTAEAENTCSKCGQPVPAPFLAHVENLGGCPDAATPVCETNAACEAEFHFASCPRWDGFRKAGS